MKKSSWTSIKEMLFAYFAISKMLYWAHIIVTVDNFEIAWQTIWQRFLTQDIVLIIFIVFIYFFEEKFVLKQKKWNGILAIVILTIVGYVIFCLIFVTQVWVVSWARSMPINIGSIIFSPFMLNMTIVYFVIAIAMNIKERFKKKEALKYAANIQTANIKIEMLKSLLSEGILNQEEFDNQKTKLLKA